MTQGDHEAPFPLQGGRAGDGGQHQPFKRSRQATQRARALRQTMTVAERALWTELRRLKMNFRRQTPVGPYVADFSHFTSRLIVEIDGPLHDGPEAQAHDAKRTAFLMAEGYRVLRFAEKDVRDRPERIADEIVAAARAPIPDPSPLRGKGE